MKWLTKSDYLKFLIHPAYLWLQKFDKDRLPPFDDSTQAIIDAGNEVEEYARQLFPDGVMVQSLFAESVRETEGYVKDGATVIFQPAVLTDRRLYAKADVLTKNSDGSWDLHEVKSATKEKPEYIHDLAFQKNAFELSGYTIKRTRLIYINNQYVRQGAVDPTQLFTSVDVTAQVDAIMARTRRGIEEALDIMALPECPDDGPATCKNWYGWRDVYRYLHPDLPESSIYNLTRLDLAQVRELTKAGVTELKKIPDNFELKPQQTAQLAALRAGEPVVHPVKIANHLQKLHFPLYFFDFETVSGGVPLYDGTRPYAQVPFQYSLHILRSRSAELEHREFLATGSQNPMPALLAQMHKDIGLEGSVVVWYKAFEGGVNEMMAQIYPEQAEFLRGVNGRLYDLMEIFSNFYYSDARFGGSASIKNVLPVVVPELSYKDLEIQKGDVASLSWKQAALGKIGGSEATKVYKDLRIYCAQDTLAMVRIYEFLMNVKETAPGAQLSLLG
jgi:uncharacterized protein DUF2779